MSVINSDELPLGAPDGGRAERVGGGARGADRVR